MVSGGHPAQAFDLVTSVGSAIIIGLVMLPLMAGLFIATAMSHIAHLLESAMNGIFGAFNSMFLDILPVDTEGIFGFSAGDWFGLFIKGAIFGIIAVAIFLLAMRACFGLRKTPVSMRQLAGVYVAAFSPLIIALPIAFIIFLIPSVTIWSLVIVVLSILAAVSNLFAFILCYIGVARLGRFATSVALPYTLFTVLTWIVNSIAIIIIL